MECGEVGRLGLSILKFRLTTSVEDLDGERHWVSGEFAPCGGTLAAPSACGYK